MTNARRHAPAFTLLELLVVISLMVGVLAIGLTLYSNGALTANGLNGATNQVSSALASARALALQNSTDAAVLFSFNNTDGCVHLRVVESIGTDTNPSSPTYGSILFQDVSDQPSETLPNQVMARIPIFTSLSATPSIWLGPQGVRDATTTDVPNPSQQLYQGPSLATSINLLAIWFGPDGTARTSTPSGITQNTFVDSSRSLTVPTSPPIAYVPANGGSNLTAIPATVLLLYDNRDIINTQYADILGNQNIADWLSAPTWNAAVSYAVGYQVTYNNSRWTCTQATSPGVIPTGGSSYWQTITPAIVYRLLTFNRYSGVLDRK